MLCLKTPSQPGWIERAQVDLPRVLIDHAHCEKKAAATAMSLVNRYPGHDLLVRNMIGLVQEEMEHFARVYEFMQQRGISLERDRGDAYVQRLHALVRKNEPERLLDQLLVAALIEARSCERFSILSHNVPDAELRAFYNDLLASEAGHYRMFFDIAREYFPEATVRTRLEELSEQEAQIIVALENEPTMHG